jgi:hypothetical protein
VFRLFRSASIRFDDVAGIALLHRRAHRLASAFLAQNNPVIAAMHESLVDAVDGSSDRYPVKPAR